MVAGALLWLVSFWPRWIAAELGLGESALLLRPWSRGLAPWRGRRPFFSWHFYGYLWRRGRTLEFVLAVIALVMAVRAASVMLRAAAAMAQASA